MTKQFDLEYGFSLLEVLIAVFILTFGLLGVTALCLTSLKRTEDAYWRVLATSHWMAMQEQQKMHDDNFLNWMTDCEQLLPRGECRYDAEKITICWRGKEGRLCL